MYPNIPQGLKSVVKEIALVRKVNGQTLSVKNGRPEGVQSDHCQVDYGNHRRLVGESNATRNIEGDTFNSITCVAKNQKRVAWVWWTESISRIRLTLTSYLLSSSRGSPIVISPTEYSSENDGLVSVDIQNCPCYGTIAYKADGDTSAGYKECSESESAF